MTQKPLKVHLTVPIILAVSIYLGFFSSLLTVYVVALLHELTHAAAARVQKVPVRGIEILPFGVTMRLDSEYIKEPRKEAIIALCGPMSNLVMAAGALVLVQFRTVSIDFWLVANLAMALLNLLPAPPLDGGRALKAILTHRQGVVKSYNFMLLLTKIIASITVLFGALVLIITRLNFSLLLIGAFLVANTVAERRVGSLIMMREILYSREKLTATMRAHTLVARHDEPARRLLKQFGYNNYALIAVVGPEMRTRAVLTETQIIDGLLEKGSRVKLSDLI